MLEIVVSDEAVRAAIGQWQVAGESRKVLASAVLAWQLRGATPASFAAEIEEQLWASLRRTQIVGAVVCVAEGVTCSQALTAGAGRQVVPPSDDFLQTVFPSDQPDIILTLPSGPFALFVGSSQHERRMFSGVMGPSHAWIFNIPAIRELVWLASAKVARLGHGIAWEMDPFPISKPQYFSPEIVNQPSGHPVDLNGLQNVLDELTPRVQILTGDRDAPIGLDEPTKSVLDNLPLLTESVLQAADPRIALQYAFAAADGSLLDRGEDAELVARRLGWLAGRDDSDTRQLRALTEKLKPIRDALAHGDPITNERIERFVSPGPSPFGAPNAVWRPPIWDRSSDEARWRAIELLCRLICGWLFLTLRLSANGVTIGLARHEVRDLLRRSQRDQQAIADLRRSNHV